MNKANRHSPPPLPPNLWLLDNKAKVNTNPQKVFLKKTIKHGEKPLSKWVESYSSP